MANNQQIILAERPRGMPTDQHLQLRDATVPEPSDGEVLVQTIYLSLDPYMRGRMNDTKSYVPPVAVGDVMGGETVGRIVTSRHADYHEGDYVLAANGWQAYAVQDGDSLRKLDPAEAPISTALSVLGMTGFTAYVGLDEIGKPQPGETVVVSAASGAVGQVVGQIARIKGSRVVGIAGAPDKCSHVVKTYGFDACVNYKEADFREQLAAACPDGIDVYWENVGGDVLDAVLGQVNAFARIPVCGQIAHYNDTEAPAGPNLRPALMSRILVNRLHIQGFLQFDYAHRRSEFERDMTTWIQHGDVHYQEDIVDGLENAVSAFQGLLEGANRGKLLVRISEDPTRG